MHPDYDIEQEDVFRRWHPQFRTQEKVAA